MVLKRPAGVSPECKPASPDASSPAHVEVLLPEVQQVYKPEWFDQPDENAQLTNYLVTAAKKRKFEKEGVEVANATGAEEAFAQEYLDFGEVDELCRGSGMDSP